MRPRKRATTDAGDLFWARLDQIINMKHELRSLQISSTGSGLTGRFAPLYSDKGRTCIASLFLIGGSWQRGRSAHEGPQRGHGRHHPCSPRRRQLPDRRQLFHAAIKGLTHLTHMHGVRLRQSDEAGTKGHSEQ